MTALDLFETLEFGPEHTGPALFPVCLYKSDPRALTYTATKEGGARRNTAREVVLVQFCLEVGSLLEEQAAERLLEMARCFGSKHNDRHVDHSRALRVRYGLVNVGPEAGAYRVVRQGKSGLVILDAGYVR